MRKKLLTLFLGASLVMGLAACGGGDNDKGSDGGGGATDTADAGGQKIYDQKCSSCHGADMKGAVGPNLTKIGSKYSKDEILDILHNGRGGMPANVVTGDDADTVAEWLSAKK